MKILLLDIETAPNKAYVWGLWDQNIYLDQIEEPGYVLCWAAKWLGDKKIMFNSLHDSSSEDMINEVHTLVDEADVVIHYYGTRFDMPTLNQEFLFWGLNPPSPYKQIDLLKTVKAKFRLPSNKLDYVAQYFKLGAKLPHKGMRLWRGCMAMDPKAWKIMERYNKQDVVLLEKLYDILLPWISNHPNTGLYVDTDIPVCNHCGSTHLQKRGTYHTATMSYQRYQCQGCGSWLKERTSSLSKEKKASILTEAR